jgi:predicted Zn finger-like uncharacterized protein
VFTQCAKCETVFRLSAEALRAAGGQVRCGRCGEVFNALTRLAEDATGFTKGESPLFLETRAEGILESIPVAAATPVTVDDLDLPPGVEFAELQFVEPVDELAGETSLEFTLPPGELDRIFIETRTSPLRQLAADGQRGERTAPQSEPAAPHPESAAPHPESPAPHPESAAPHPESPARAAAPVNAVPTTAAPLPRPLTRVPGLEVSEEVRLEMLSSLRPEAARKPHASRKTDTPQNRLRRRARWSVAAWLTAALLLAVLLGTQLVRSNRDWVAAHVPLLGGVGSAAANLSAYQLRQWGVTGDPGAKGTLRVRASIMNTAAQLQPYPLLRVTLVNRFGTHVGAREFTPAEYLGHGVARMLAPGERIEATLDILDPGKEAEGFEIDVCLRNADARIVCAGDAATQVK